ncbi:MAG: phosphodiester glycosidase family protein [Chloroflexi bacterium]|nr:phosphodiester glycosidase family protein [Chloroflexota bacterium]
MFSNRAVYGRLIALFVFVGLVLSGLWQAKPNVYAANRTASRSCFAEVKWNNAANLRIGPSTNYGIEKVAVSGFRMRVLGQDDDGEWLQVEAGDPINFIGWVWWENVNLFGKCAGLPDTGNNIEIETAPAPPAEVELPEFAQGIDFTHEDQIFQLNDGMLYVRYEHVIDKKTTLQAHVLIADLNNPHVDVGVHLGAVADSTATLVSDMVKDAGAFVAINGDFYGGNYMPQGLTVIDGELVIAPKHRATFAITAKHNVFIGYFTESWTWPATVIAETGSIIPLQLANLPCDPAWLCIYTHYMRWLPVKWGYDGIRVLLSPEFEVLDIVTDRYTEIPEGHYVLRAGTYTDAGKWLRENVQIGDTLQVNLETHPDWRNYENAISGGPIIVKNGRFRQDCDPNVSEALRVCEEFDDRFRTAHYFDVHIPRSAVGYNRDNKTLILIMVEGYELGAGITQEDLANLLIRYGAQSAMEFDGGGSSSLWVDRGFVNDFGYDGERRVSDALMLYWNE